METKQILWGIFIAVVSGVILLLVDKLLFKAKFLQKIVELFKLLTDRIWVLINKIPYRIVNIRKGKKHYIEILEDVDISDVLLNNGDYIFELKKGRILCVETDLYSKLHKDSYKDVKYSDIILVNPIKDEKFRLSGAYIFLYKMPCDRCEGGFISICSEYKGEYIYKSEYDKYKDNLVKVVK